MAQLQVRLVMLCECENRVDEAMFQPNSLPVKPWSGDLFVAALLAVVIVATGQSVPAMEVHSRCSVPIE